MRCLHLVPTLLEAELLVGKGREEALLGGGLSWAGRSLGVIGMGPVDAGPGALRFLMREPWDLCLLLGLGGTLDPEAFPPGSLVEATGFFLEGLGAVGRGGGGGGELRIPPSLMGLPGSARGPLPFEDRETPTARIGGLPACGFLTVLASSADPEKAAERRAAHPDAGIEEMEGFAVARAARLSEVPFASVRAVSNRAGERDPQAFGGPGAMDALAEALLEGRLEPG